MTQLYIWNNACLSLEYSLHIDLTTGKSFYKTNYVNYQKENYECFFLVKHSARKSIQSALILLNDWQSCYGNAGQAVIDGYRWNIKIIGNGIREYIGENCKPPEFDAFIARIENLIQKPLSGDKGLYSY